MNRIDICRGEYAAHWSLTDLYDYSREKLQAALASGEDFDTGWWGCKKEIRYARICRDGGEIRILVSCHMDDLWDGDALIYDALWEECGAEEQLPDELIDTVRSFAIDCGIDEQTELSEVLPTSAGFDELVKVIDRLEDEAEAHNTEMYNELRAVVRGEYENWKGEQA